MAVCDSWMLGEGMKENWMMLPIYSNGHNRQCLDSQSSKFNDQCAKSLMDYAFNKLSSFFQKYGSNEYQQMCLSFI